MKNLRKKIIMFFVLAGMLCLITPTKANAALQSNGGTASTKKFDDWIIQIRQMEAMGGTLGLSETINTTGLLSTTDSNGLDCHMEKNTEYGALVILSASSYGNPNKITDGETTTGNVTGVKMNINSEWVAAGAGLTETTYAKVADLRYINNDYGTTPGGKYHTGDAMDIGTWHSSRGTNWITDVGGKSVGGFLRGYSGSVFSYSGECWHSGAPAYVHQLHPSRAVVVLGTGL